MKSLISLVLLTLAVNAFAHPAGTYILNSDKEITLTIKKIGKCPTDVAGALKGGLKTFTFSDKASVEPYNFVSGHFVEIHVGSQEVYVQTNETCVPVERGGRYEADADSFGGYTLDPI